MHAHAKYRNREDARFHALLLCLDALLRKSDAIYGVEAPGAFQARRLLRWLEMLQGIERLEPLLQAFRSHWRESGRPPAIWEIYGRIPEGDFRRGAGHAA